MTLVKEDCLNILFSSDDAYAQHLGAAMYSTLEQNVDFQKIQIFIVNNEISAENRDKLEYTASLFHNAKIIWIDFGEWKSKLTLNMAWEISLTAYARLFVGSMLPDNLEKVLYLDCDMIVRESLRPMWETDLQGNIIGAVQDFVGDHVKAAVGLNPHEAYVNSGMLLIDLRKWREQEYERKCLQFIDDHCGRVIHHDQGVLNGVLHGRFRVLPIAYNLMTIHFIFSRRQLCKYYDDHAEFYTEEEVNTAKEQPKILHYTPSFTSRPWVKGCKHPYKAFYWTALLKTPWKNAVPVKNRAKLHVRLVDWRYRVLPY